MYGESTLEGGINEYMIISTFEYLTTYEISNTTSGIIFVKLILI